MWWLEAVETQSGFNDSFVTFKRRFLSEEEAVDEDDEPAAEDPASEDVQEADDEGEEPASEKEVEDEPAAEEPASEEEGEDEDDGGDGGEIVLYYYGDLNKNIVLTSAGNKAGDAGSRGSGGRGVSSLHREERGEDGADGESGSSGAHGNNGKTSYQKITREQMLQHFSELLSAKKLSPNDVL